MRMRIIEREGQQGQWTEKHCLARSKSQPLLPEIYSAPPNTKTPSLSPSLSQIHCKSKWINPRPQSDKTSRLHENWCQNSCHQANCTKLSTSLRKRSLILVKEICEENRICHLCGKVAITEQRPDQPHLLFIGGRKSAMLLLLLLMLLLLLLMLLFSETGPKYRVSQKNYW